MKLTALKNIIKEEITKLKEKVDRKDELYNIGPDKDYCVVDGDGIEGPLPNCPSGCPCGAGCVCMDGKTRYPKGIVGAKDGSMGKLKRIQGKIVYYRSKRSM